ncbi:MAG: tRNA (N6-threonylcarbamoyladenosine(37)-N6)-methyltransferase TrmO [Planctomycetes bacterium]|nr:tRNA (N6-threonylcarbamoyladenosine(37)-N6)-methyltransferase TrmO [Planctomycetota bacterium]
MKGSRKPGLSPADERARFDLSPDLALTVKPIGVVHSPYTWRDEAPRQASVGEPRTGVIVLRPGLQNTLASVLGFDYLWVLFWFHHSHGWKQQVVPPRDRVKRGVFATRSPDRPNPIGLSAVRVLAVVGTKVRIRGLDLLDGTPVLDLKPYIPAYDAFPDAKAGWVDALTDPGPDHRYT